MTTPPTATTARAATRAVGATMAWLALAALAAPARADPVEYRIDPDHTFPSFEADHMGGVSVWRGKMTKSAGTVVLDKAAGTGRVDATVDAGSIDFGQRQLNQWAAGPEFLDAHRFGSVFYKGRLEDFADGAPRRVVGELTLHGVTRPLVLSIVSFKCVPHPLLRRELCGADAQGRFDRSEFGLAFGKEYGFRMDVLLRIQVEAIATK